jgi:hypothetical protein
MLHQTDHAGAEIAADSGTETRSSNFSNRLRRVVCAEMIPSYAQSAHAIMLKLET